MTYLLQLLQQVDLTAVTALLIRLAAVFLCLSVHETCHGLAAYALGDPTAKRLQRLSLNPLHHIDWMGLACMIFCGFGWAKPVPVDPRYFKKPKQGMALTALAGPLSNLLLAVLLLLGGKLVYLYAPYSAFTDGLFQFCLSAAMLSVGLGLFNLIPIPPLDGSKILAVLLPDKAYLLLMQYERYGMLLLLVLVWLGVGDNILSRGISAVFYGLLSLIF